MKKTLMLAVVVAALAVPAHAGALDDLAVAIELQSMALQNAITQQTYMLEDALMQQRLAAERAAADAALAAEERAWDVPLRPAVPPVVLPPGPRYFIDVPRH